MPRELLDKVARAKRFNQGYTTVSYLSAAIVDQRLHQLKAGEMAGRLTASCLSKPRC